MYYCVNDAQQPIGDTMIYTAFNFANSVKSDRQELNADELQSFMVRNPRNWKVAFVIATNEKGEGEEKILRVADCQHFNGEKVFSWGEV